MKKNLTKFAVLSALLICLLCAFCACSGKYELSPGTEPDISQADTSLVQANTKLNKKNKITASGAISLYYDKKTASVTVRDENTGFNWYSLPTYISDKAKAVPCVVSLEVIYNGKVYFLDSQQDSLKNGGVTAEKRKNGITVTYNFKKSADDGSMLEYTVPVDYTLSDSNFYVSVNCAQIESGDTSKKAVLTKIGLLNFFGSSRLSSESDYIFVPDNCGAVIHTKAAGKSESEFSYKIYGGENGSVIGAFGMKKKGKNKKTKADTQNAFAAVIQKGGALATVSAYTKESSRGYNAVGAKFDITEYETATDGEKTYAAISDTSYEGEIKICYRFLTGNKADYSGMAVACREQLIRDGVLSSGSVRSDTELPFLASVIGAAKTGRSEPSILTSYDQLQDMLIYLKSKGFVNIYVNYRGTLSGGLEQKEIGKADFLATLGNEEERLELQNYISAQGMTLFTEAGYVTFSGASRTSAATRPDNSKNILETKNCFGITESRNFAAYSELEESTNSFLKFLRNNSVGAVCVCDAASVLYDDASSQATREDVKNRISEENAAISAHAKLMVKNGNFYALKNASMVSDMKLSTNYPESEAYECVPFTLLILHGTLDYSCEPINYSDDYSSAMLRCIEYGAVPEFEWCYENVSYGEENSEGMNRYSYSDWATEAYAFYEKANAVLGSLRDERMTSHYEVQDGLYCSEYGGTSVYVNYTDKDIEIKSLAITVPAGNFVRIN